MQPGRAGLFFLLFAVASTSPGLAQSRRPPADTNLSSSSGSARTYSIRGTVRLVSSEGTVELVRVDLMYSYNQIVETTFTHANGDFEFSRIPAGNYSLVVEMRGYEPIRESVQLDGPRWGIALYLKVLPQATPEESGNTVSERELKLPRKARNAYRKGIERLYEQKDPQGSLAQFQRAIAEFPGYYEAYHQLGVARLRLGQAAAAEEAFRKSIEISQGKYADPYFALGSTFNNNKKFAEAEPLLRRGLDMDRNDWHGHYELARALLGLDRLDAAETSGQEACTRRSDFPAVHLLLAEVHQRKHDYLALLNDLDEYLKLEPDGPMSTRARELRDELRRGLEGARNAPAQNPRQP